MDHHGVRGPSEVTAAKRGDSARPAHGGSSLHPLSSELRVLLPFRKERAPLGGAGGGLWPPGKEKGQSGEGQRDFSASVVSSDSLQLQIFSMSRCHILGENVLNPIYQPLTGVQ